MHPKVGKVAGVQNKEVINSILRELRFKVIWDLGLEKIFKCQIVGREAILPYMAGQGLHNKDVRSTCRIDLWKAIKDQWEDFIKNPRFEVGNDKRIRFWTVIWRDSTTLDQKCQQYIQFVRQERGRSGTFIHSGQGQYRLGSVFSMRLE